MSWRVVVVSSNAKVDYRLDCLIVRTAQETRRVHLSEIAVLMLESTAISITCYALSELVRWKVKVVLCDHARNPQAELVPTHGSYDTTAKIRAQLAWGACEKEAVWTELVREKLRRQHALLQAGGWPQQAQLARYEQQLQWNDASNCEAHAAKTYFTALFGQEFTRARHCPVNAALNYGYTVLLSAINREISSAGYLNQMGIFHQNVHNAYNLACDFIEPLRPLIDRAVYLMQPCKLEHEEKMLLLNLLNSMVRVGRCQQHLLYALHLYCAGLFRALERKSIEEIEWIDYELSLYENSGTV